MGENSSLRDLREKTSHLRQILQDAKESPGKIPKGGRIIFSYHNNAVGEEYALRVCLDKNGEPYFLGKGSYCEEVSSSRLIQVISCGERYLPTNPSDFKREVR